MCKNKPVKCYGSLIVTLNLAIAKLTSDGILRAFPTKVNEANGINKCKSKGKVYV